VIYAAIAAIGTVIILTALGVGTNMAGFWGAMVALIGYHVLDSFLGLDDELQQKDSQEEARKSKAEEEWIGQILENPNCQIFKKKLEAVFIQGEEAYQDALKFANENGLQNEERRYIVSSFYQVLIKGEEKEKAEQLSTVFKSFLENSAAPLKNPEIT
jgi:hypothetical protein